MLNKYDKINNKEKKKIFNKKKRMNAAQRKEWERMAVGRRR